MLTYADVCEIIQGVRLRVGDRVAIFPPLLHTNEKLFGSDPHLYVYRRFLSQNENDNQLNDLSREIMPFGGSDTNIHHKHTNARARAHTHTHTHNRGR
jgi:hypothetical protein